MISCVLSSFPMLFCRGLPKSSVESVQGLVLRNHNIPRHDLSTTHKLEKARYVAALIETKIFLLVQFRQRFYGVLHCRVLDRIIKVVLYSLLCKIVHDGDPILIKLCTTFLHRSPDPISRCNIDTGSLSSKRSDRIILLDPFDLSSSPW